MKNNVSVIFSIFIYLFTSNLFAGSIASIDNQLIVRENIQTSKYNRSYFSNWIDLDQDCQNTRAETLIEQSAVPVKFKTHKKCVVESGEWVDFYTLQVITKANDLDVDHVVPLKEAYISGAQRWSRIERIQFANDPLNLVLSHKSVNRSKGSKDISQWMPAIASTHCQYNNRWVLIKKKYSLTVNESENKVISDLTEFCAKDNKDEWYNFFFSFINLLTALF